MGFGNINSVLMILYNKKYFGKSFFSMIICLVAFLNNFNSRQSWKQPVEEVFIYKELQLLILIRKKVFILMKKHEEKICLL